MALSSLGGRDSTLSDTGGEGNSCSVVTRQGVGEQDLQAACSDRMKAKDLRLLCVENLRDLHLILSW